MSNTILFFFILPLAVIVFSIALEKILNSPLLVASIVLVVMLILSFAIPVLTTQFFISAIVLAILSLATTILYCIIMNAWCRNCNRRNSCETRSRSCNNR